MGRKRGAQLSMTMHPRLRARRGLAEIVGTLMLVVIVVAAATAFSFFVAAYQTQLQAEETFNHDKALENLRVFDLFPEVNESLPKSENLTSLRVDVASLDVNTIVISGVTINGFAVVNYTITNPSGTRISPPECLNGNALVAFNATCVLTLPSEAQVLLNFSLQFGMPGYALTTNETLTEGGLVQFAIFTELGNEFVQAFVPPVAIAGVTAIDGFPILDGANSYQPPTNSSDVVTIDQWSWYVTAAGSKCEEPTDQGDYSGQEYEFNTTFTAGCTYVIDLTVTNSEYLIGSSSIDYAVGP